MRCRLCILNSLEHCGLGIGEVEEETVRRRNLCDKGGQEEGNLKSADYLVVRAERTHSVKSVSYIKIIYNLQQFENSIYAVAHMVVLKRAFSSM